MNRLIIVPIFFLSIQSHAEIDSTWNHLWESATPASKVESDFQKTIQKSEEDSLKPYLRKELFEKTHCTSKEVWVFNCKIKKKFLSLCASNDISQDTGYLQYRYGAINNLELVFPQKKIIAKKHFKSSMTGYSGGGEYRVGFSKGRYKYIVFNKTIKEEWRTDQSISTHSSSGVYVVEDDKIIATLECTPKINNTEWNINLNPIIPETEFVYYE